MSLLLQWILRTREALLGGGCRTCWASIGRRGRGRDASVQLRADSKIDDDGDDDEKNDTSEQ